MKAKIRRFIVYILSETIGSLFILLDPKKADELAKAGMTVQMQHLNLTFKERLMRKAILRTTKRKREFDLLAEFHQNYWKKKGADFFSETQSRLVNNYLPNCEFVFEILRKQLVKESDQFHTLVEIGTGNGIVLNYLSQGFTQFKKLIGIDLSDVQIQKNIEKYSENPRLEFETGDAFHWIDTHKNDYTCFLTFHGVLEYFTEERLQIFLNKISASGKVIFLAVRSQLTIQNYLDSFSRFPG